MKKSNFVLIIAIVICILVIAYFWIKPVEYKNKETTNSAIPQITHEQTSQQLEQPAITFENEEQSKEYIEECAKKSGYSIEDYPEKFFDILVKDPSALDYVVGYPENVGKDKPFEFKLDDDNKIPLFIQWDTRWGYHKFKNGVVGLDGCGATCLSMAVVYLTGNTEYLPNVVSDFIAENGYFIDGSGTSWDLFSKGVSHYGLKSRGVSTNKQSVIDAVERKNPVIASVGKGDFTKKGHYILIAGYENGEFIINDPNSLTNSQKRWSWERIEPQIKTMWEIYN